MKKIITFLGIHGALSCSAFLNKFNDYEITVCSTNNFFETLEKLSQEKINELVIIGAGPGVYAQQKELCVLAIAEILQNSTKITYIAHFDISFIANSLNQYADFRAFWNCEKELYNITADFFDVNPKFIKFLEVNQKNISHAVEEAKFRFFNFNNREFYPDFLKNLSSFNLYNSIRVLDNKLNYYNSNFLFGKSDKVKLLKKHLEKIGEDSFCNVLISGESGTGKTTLAYSLHFASKRKGNFEVISCANFQENLLESKLFGWEKGAFTGADKSQEGLFEIADNGTLFMDEIGEMPMVLQSKLLRVLQDGKFKRVGGKQEYSVDVRIIAATNRDLKEMINQNQFRADLYYRIAAIDINSIPLREQIQDIGYISNFILREIYKKRDNVYNFVQLDNSQIETLKKYNWPGNVRQLQNSLERAYILDEWDFKFLQKEVLEEEVLKKENLKENFIQDKSDSEIVKNVSKDLDICHSIEDIKDFETFKKDYIKKVFKICNNNITKTASKLKISKNTVKTYIK
ncbi:MAG: sigma-54 dependent transcriptional regulator [Candidatus Muirbacterium halophilum]|nr:sigma-54 dependent transcriptional regulator [Candidatus Muirbacterium halophilum]MCK9476732.1 sigma-54 dependent transcriptional regulator [Candidatus Muirbacterium halophilum]